MELPVQYMKTTSAENGQNMCRKCSCHALLMFLCFVTGNSMNNLLSYCGLVDPITNASEKGSAVKVRVFSWFCYVNTDIQDCKTCLIGTLEYLI